MVYGSPRRPPRSGGLNLPPFFTMGQACPCIDRTCVCLISVTATHLECYSRRNFIPQRHPRHGGTTARPIRRGASIALPDAMTTVTSIIVHQHQSNRIILLLHGPSGELNPHKPIGPAIETIHAKHHSSARDQISLASTVNLPTQSSSSSASCHALSSSRATLRARRRLRPGGTKPHHVQISSNVSSECISG